jgi:hypothetical protein
MRESDGTVYYVDKDHGSASDSNPGTSESAPWATLQKAFSTTPLANGIVKIKKSATPYGSATITRSNGSEANIITVEAYDPNDRPIFNGRTQFESPASYWRVRNLIGDGAGTADVGGSMFGADAANHIEWYGCEGMNAPGNSTTNVAGTQGFQPDNCADLWYINCLSHDNGDNTLDHGWYCESGVRYYWWNCIAYGNGGYGVQVYNGTGSNVEPSRDMYFYNFVSDDTGRVGPVDGLTTGRGGWVVDSGHADGTTSNHWKNIHWFNCLSTFHTRGSSNRSGFRHISAKNQTQTTIDNWPGGYPKSSINNCMCGGNTDADLVFNSLASQASVLTVSNLWEDTDPLYVNQAGRNYRLQAGSPARGVGLADYTPPFDFAGNTRTVADLGAYAYGS